VTEIVQEIYDLYQQETRTGKRRGRKPTASDGLASLCSRYAWYEANSPRRGEIPALLRRRMDHGTQREEVIISEVRSLPNWKIKGVGLRIVQWGIAGKVDSLVCEKGFWKLLEIKTMNPADFSKFKEEGLVAFPRYYEQFMFYLAALEKMPFTEPITSGILLAENTFPLGELYAEELTLDLGCIDEMETKQEELGGVLHNRLPPPRPFPADSPRCTHCWRKPECWEIRQEPTGVSLNDLRESTKCYEALLVYLRNQTELTKVGDAVSEAKRTIRNILDEEGVTEVRADLGHGLFFKISLKEVSVKEYMVKGHTYPRLDIR
jgi:hypothetical protein